MCIDGESWHVPAVQLLHVGMSEPLSQRLCQILSFSLSALFLMLICMLLLKKAIGSRILLWGNMYQKNTLQIHKHQSCMQRYSLILIFFRRKGTLGFSEGDLSEYGTPFIIRRPQDICPPLGYTLLLIPPQKLKVIKTSWGSQVMSLTKYLGNDVNRDLQVVCQKHKPRVWVGELVPYSHYFQRFTQPGTGQV